MLRLPCTRMSAAVAGSMPLPEPLHTASVVLATLARKHTGSVPVRLEKRNRRQLPLKQIFTG